MEERLLEAVCRVHIEPCFLEALEHLKTEYFLLRDFVQVCGFGLDSLLTYFKSLLGQRWILVDQIANHVLVFSLNSVLNQRILSPRSFEGPTHPKFLLDESIQFPRESQPNKKFKCLHLLEICDHVFFVLSE